MPIGFHFCAVCLDIMQPVSPVGDGNVAAAKFVVAKLLHEFSF